MCPLRKKGKIFLSVPYSLTNDAKLMQIIIENRYRRGTDDNRCLNIAMVIEKKKTKKK